MIHHIPPSLSLSQLRSGDMISAVEQDLMKEEMILVEQLDVRGREGGERREMFTIIL